MRDLLRNLIPSFIRQARRDFILRRRWRLLERLPPKEAFRKIYEDGIWGKSSATDDPYFSGSGSHTDNFATIYVAAIEQFARTHPEKLTAADLGCGDFAIGSRVCRLFSHYIACDIVEPLIERNRKKFSALEVDFRVVDVTSDALPPADVGFLRQVLQHLSNEQIQRAIAKIPAAYRYLILSEHVPASGDFVPNLDKPMGPHTRLDSGGRPSGVVLTAPPFNLRPSKSTVLCEVQDYLGVIRTTLFEFD
jgi:hypothetical protein